MNLHGIWQNPAGSSMSQQWLGRRCSAVPQACKTAHGTGDPSADMQHPSPASSCTTKEQHTATAQCWQAAPPHQPTAHRGKQRPQHSSGRMLGCSTRQQLTRGCRGGVHRAAGQGSSPLTSPHLDGPSTEHGIAAVHCWDAAAPELWPVQWVHSPASSCTRPPKNRA